MRLLTQINICCVRRKWLLSINMHLRHCCNVSVTVQTWTFWQQHAFTSHYKHIHDQSNRLRFPNYRIGLFFTVILQKHTWRCVWTRWRFYLEKILFSEYIYIIWLAKGNFLPFGKHKNQFSAWIMWRSWCIVDQIIEMKSNTWTATQWINVPLK